MSDKPTIYIAGPMSGYPQYNFPAFDKARDELEKNGWQVGSPADMDREHGFDPTVLPLEDWIDMSDGSTYKEYCFPTDATIPNRTNNEDKETFLKNAMERDKAAIVNCDAVYLLEGWEKSEGVKVELEHLQEYEAGITPKTAIYLTAHPQTPYPTPNDQSYFSSAMQAIHTWMIADDPEACARFGFTTLDSGEREEYETGAVRDTNKGKGRFDLLPYAPLKRLAGLYERGAEKYDDNNWRRGIPTNRAYESALRHLHQANELNTLKRLGRVTDDPMASEDHLAAAAFNIMVIMQNEEDGVE